MEATGYKIHNEAVTLSEIIAGRSLQTQRAGFPSERVLEVYFQNYVPSARMAYDLAGKPDWLKRTLEDLANGLTYEFLSKIFADNARLDLANSLSHSILLVRPGRFRDVPSIIIPTRYIFDLLHHYLAKTTSDAAVQLYKMSIRNQSTRANSGHVQEEALRMMFRKGGQWSTTREGTVNRVWKLPSRFAMSEWLRLGYENSIMHISSKEFRNEPIILEPNEKLDLQDALYFALPGKHATSDAFVYEARTQRATIFQATVDGSHKVKVDELKWLMGLGVKEFHYVAITSPWDSLNVLFTKDWDKIVTKKYHLVFPIN